jgi:hypothetical protein
VNTYRLYLYGCDGAIAQVSEIECPADDFAMAFASQRRRDYAKAELWLDDRLVARLGAEEGKMNPVSVARSHDGPTANGAG